MNTLRSWFCHKKGELFRWTLIIMAASPLAAWLLSRLFEVQPGTVIVAIGASLFAMWRPYRDSWLRQSCSRQRLCGSH